MNVTRLFFFVSAVCCLILPLNATNMQKDYMFHSVFVYNFTKYIEWPNVSSSINIGILKGDENIINSFKKMAETKSSATLQFNINEISDITDAEACQILFITKSQSSLLSEFSTALKDKPVLIVTEEEGLIEKGSGINFITVEGKLNIELNKNVLESAGLKIASQLMALAIVV